MMMMTGTSAGTILCTLSPLVMLTTRHVLPSIVKKSRLPSFAYLKRSPGCQHRQQQQHQNLHDSHESGHRTNKDFSSLMSLAETGDYVKPRVDFSYKYYASAVLSPFLRCSSSVTLLREKSGLQSFTQAPPRKPRFQRTVSAEIKGHSLRRRLPLPGSSTSTPRYSSSPQACISAVSSVCMTPQDFTACARSAFSECRKGTILL